jgi:CDGSH-type Zn-finger protein
MAAVIQPRPNGPYLVKGVDDLRDAAGQPIPHEPVFALCRCGGSKNKPFCDSTHKTNGFSGARVSDGSKDRVDTYSAPGITIHDNRSICAHAGICTDNLAAVFKYGSEPWIDASGASAAEIAKTVARCPSGALRCSGEGSTPDHVPGSPSITVTTDGPYAVRGDIELVDAGWAQGAPRDRYTLCRCGASRNKPFCDGSHWDAGFKDYSTRRQLRV